MHAIASVQLVVWFMFFLVSYVHILTMYVQLYYIEKRDVEHTIFTWKPREKNHDAHLSFYYFLIILNDAR